MRLVREAGDTIIEVMLAFTVFAMLAVGAITIMNQGVASAQEALETTLVRQQIDGQAEALRFVHQAYMTGSSNPTGTGAKFRDIIAKAQDKDASEFGGSTDCLNSIPDSTNPFIINPRTTAIVDAVTIKAMKDSSAPAYAQLVYNTDNSAVPYGLWIEAVNGKTTVPTQPQFIDFHIRACWYSITNDAPRTLGTIVRLYYAS